MPRLEFPSETRRQAYKRSNGICECHRIPWLNRPTGCGVKLGPGNVFYEHITPDAIRPDNSIENCAALAKTCWSEKTATYDLPLIAKSDRQQDRHRGIRPTPRQALVGSRSSNIKIRIGKPPVWRDSGKPLWSDRR